MTSQSDTGSPQSQTLSALAILNDDQMFSTISSALASFGVRHTLCRTSQDATRILETFKFDLLIADFDIQRVSELVEMNVTNARGYRTTVIAVTADLELVGGLLSKRIHYAVLKSLITSEFVDILKSACRLVLIEKRISFRHAVMIKAEASVLENGAQRPLGNALVLDISHKGLCLKASALRKNAIVFVNFLLPGTEDPIHTIGDVMWTDEHGRAGIRFRYIHNMEFTRLRDYMNARCPWSQVLARLPEHTNSIQPYFKTSDSSDVLAGR